MSTPISPRQLQDLVAAVQAQLGPPSMGEGFDDSFAALFEAGNTVVIDNSGLRIYMGTPATGNLIGSWSATGGNDPQGNPFPQGLALGYGVAGQTNILTVQDGAGDTLAGIDATGNITGQLISANTDVLIGGNSVTTLIGNAAQGLVAYGRVAVPFPASGSFAGSFTALWELDQLFYANRVYQVVVQAGLIQFSGWGGGTPPASYYLDLRYTTDGSTPSINTPQAAFSGCVVVALGNDTPSPPLSAIFYPSVQATYRFLVGGYTTISNTAAYKFMGYGGPYMTINDLGAQSAGNMNNNLLLIGTGTGGGTGPQNYTETFRPSATHAYYSNSGLRNTNDIMTHGAYSGESPNYQYSYITWGTGSLGNSLNTVLNYTVNSVSLRLTCLHSWSNYGMYFGLHSSTVLGGAQGTYSNILNPGGTFISEGATATYGLSGSQWAPFKAAGTMYLALSPDSGNLTSLSWYGYFAGQDAPAGQQPLLTVQYTH